MARMAPLEVEATVRPKNQMTIPQAVAARLGIVPGCKLVIIDSGAEDGFSVRLIRQSYAGALARVFGTTDENIAYVRGEREAWG